MTRPRACGALIHNGMILMVQHVEGARSYWTLPGGGLEAGETPAEAAVREVWEETGLRARAVRLLFESTYGDADSPEYYFLMAADNATGDDGAGGALSAIALGQDPEEAHLPAEQRLLQGVAWHSLEDVKDDGQVSAVLRALGESTGEAAERGRTERSRDKHD